VLKLLAPAARAAANAELKVRTHRLLAAHSNRPVKPVKSNTKAKEKPQRVQRLALNNSALNFDPVAWENFRGRFS